MRNWKARLLVGFMLVAMMLATVAGPAMANHTERHEDRIDERQDRNDNDRFHNDSFFFVNSFDNDNDDDGLVLLISPFGFFAVEEIDIDCDGFDDDGDLFIDEGADCEIEIEFFEFWD